MSISDLSEGQGVAFKGTVKLEVGIKDGRSGFNYIKRLIITNISVLALVLSV
jgi:hypothetical protein